MAHLTQAERSQYRERGARAPDCGQSRRASREAGERASRGRHGRRQGRARFPGSRARPGARRADRGWPIRPLATCTAWIALDASTRDNGCPRVIPGSHAGKKLFHHLREDRSDIVLTQRIDDPAFDEASAVDIELEPGQMSLHDVYMIHGATVNRSSRRRAGVAIRYMPGTSVFERNLMPASSASGYLVDFSTRPL